MNADVLRRAAALMRERAEAASLWEMEDGTSLRLGWHDVHEMSGDPFDHAHAVHISSWHPAVALAVADWLDTTIRQHESDEDGVDYFETCPCDDKAHALAVARAYLGGSA